MRNLALSCCAFLLVSFAACENKLKPEASAPPTSKSKAAETSDSTATGAATQPVAESSGHGPLIDLGAVAVDGLNLKATRDAGELKPGGDAAIDVWLTAADGSPVSVNAVRFWIGTADAKGSMKARAQIEDSKEPDRWHTHAEVPDPLPAESRLWVEIESKDGRKSRASFALK